MSHYETSEQRQIRELRSKISTMTEQANYQASQNSTLSRELDAVRRQQQTENARLLQQIQQQQSAAQRDRSQMSDRIRALDEQVRERERLQQERIQAMQREHESRVRHLEGEFQAERRELRDEIAQTRSEMQQGLSQLRNETDRKLQTQREENQRALNQMSVKLEGRISDVDRKVNTLAQEIAAKDQGDRELAVYWAQEAARMVRQIQDSFKPQLLDARRISILERKIRQAHEDVESGQYQTSITAGRDAFFDALDMKEDLAAAELEWNYWFNAVKERETELIQALDSAEHRVYEIDTKDGVITYDNGIDYWTYGQLTIVRNQITELRQSLENTAGMTLEELQAAEEKVRALQEQLALVENAAHINVAMAVSRYETAVKIGDILDSDFELTESDGEYFAREDREEYHASFQNPVTGQRAAVVIAPELDKETGVVRNHIDVLIGNVDNDPVKRREVRTAVEQRLQNEVEGCHFPCAERFGDGTIQEVERVGDIAAVEAGDVKVRAAIPGTSAQTSAPVSRVRSVKAK